MKLSRVEVALAAGLLMLLALVVFATRYAKSDCEKNGGQWVTGYANGGGFFLCLPRRSP